MIGVVIISYRLFSKILNVLLYSAIATLLFNFILQILYVSLICFAVSAFGIFANKIFGYCILCKRVKFGRGYLVEYIASHANDEIMPKKVVCRRCIKRYNIVTSEDVGNIHENDYYNRCYTKKKRIV